MGMIQRYPFLASNPDIQEVYKIVRTGYLENSIGLEFPEIKERLPDYTEIKIANCIGKMCFASILEERVLEKDGKAALIYRPQRESEWAVLIERILDLNPEEVGFDSEALGK